MPIKWPGAEGAYLPSFPPQLRNELLLVFQHQYRALLDNGWPFAGSTLGAVSIAQTQTAQPFTGILPIGQGGTGLSALGSADQVLGVNHAATALIYKTIAAGTGIAVVGADGSITLSNTGVTSVALSLPAIFSVSGSPVTTTGTLTATLATQSANTHFAGPSSGAAAAPTFRALVAADLGSGTADATKYLRGDLAWTTLPTTAAPSGSAGGDLSGSYPNPGVAKIQGRSVSSSAPSDGQYLKWVAANSDWEPATGTVSGTAGGDLAGTYPNPRQLHSIAMWNSSDTYANHDLVIGSDGNYYLAVASSTNKDPTLDSGTNWVLWFLTANLTLTVQTFGGRFNSLQSGTNPVWSFIQYATIPQPVTLTIQVNDGTYAISSSQSLNHPFGQQISVLGNASTPANCVLQLSTGINCIVVNAGTRIGSFNGFTIDGQTKPSGSCGVFVSQRSNVTIGANCVFKNLDVGMEAANAGRINAGACTVQSCNTGVFGQNLSEVPFVGTVTNCTTGIWASIQSRAQVGAATVTSCTTGLKVDNSSLIYAIGTSLSGNTANLSQSANSVTSNGCINN